MPPLPQVVCLGEALLDRLGPLGGDPALEPAGCLDRLGGAPANVACALARLGTPSAFVGRLGRDAAGEVFAALFAARGVDQRGLQWDPDRPSRIVLVRRDAAGERQFQGFAGERGAGFADQALDAGAVAAALGPLLAAARWLLVGTIPLASPPAAAALGCAVAAAAQADVPLAVDVNWRPTFWEGAAPPTAPPTRGQLEAIEPLLLQAALIKCAAEEAHGLFGSSDPQRICAALPRRPLVLVTDGAAPLRWCGGERWAGTAATGSLTGSLPGSLTGSLPAHAVTVVDSTGAGDAFMAGVLHGLCQQPPLALLETLRLALACGALVCQGAGAIDPQPNAAQVRAFLAAAPAL